MKALIAAGVTAPQYPEFSVFGFTLREPPHVVFHPSFAVSFANFRSKITAPADFKLAPRATLVVEGSGVTLGAVYVDGALVIKAVPGARVGEALSAK